MKSSAMKTGLTLLTVSTMAAAVWIGCTTSTNTSDLSDGGTSSGTTPPTTPPPGSGDEDGGTGTCEQSFTGNAKPDLPGCETCLAAECCTEITGCFAAGLVDETDSGLAFSCNDWKECDESCVDTATDEASYNTCLQDNCRAAAGSAAAGLEQAYDTFFACAETKCTSTCFEETDAGN